MKNLLLLSILAVALSSFACTADAGDEKEGESSSDLVGKKTTKKTPKKTTTAERDEVAMSDQYKCYRACMGHGLGDCSACDGVSTVSAASVELADDDSE